jgi:glycosyltransferase involved in cell wall biosynthesis
MKVVLLTTGLTIGGVERVVAELADGLAARRHDVALVCLKGPLQVLPRHAQVQVTCLGMDSPGKWVPSFFRFRSLLREFRPDIVHSHMFHAAMLARLGRLAAGASRRVHHAYRVRRRPAARVGIPRQRLAVRHIDQRQP